MKHIRRSVFSILCAAALLLSLSVGVLASGEAGGSGEASGSGEAEPIEALVTATAEGTVIDPEGYTYKLASGEIREDGMYGAVMTTDDYYMNVVAVTDGGRYTIDGCDISKTVSAVPTSAGGVIAHVTDGQLFIRDSRLTTAGKGGIMYDDYPVECSDTGTMVIVDSEITQTGLGGDPDGYTIDVADPPSNEALTISGYARASMSLGTGSTYYYGSVVSTEGWAAMSTDMGSVKFYAYNSEAVAQHGGYGTYADTSCSNWFYGCDLIGAEIGAIISNNGAVRLYAGDAADDAMFEGLTMAGLSTDDIELTDRRSGVYAGRNCFQLHAPEESKGATRNQIGVVEAYDTDFITSRELDEQADLVDWYDDYGPALGEYVDFVSGAVFLVKSHVADIRLTRCTAESYSGVLLMTAVNSDSMGVYALNSHDMTGKGTALTLTDCAIAGDVCAYDYQRSCAVTLDNTGWAGAYITWDKDEWDAAWSDACAQDEKCYWLLDEATYNTGTESVTSLTVGADSVWIVTGESDMDSLTVEPGGVIEGDVFVDGAPVDTSAGGTWTGVITVSPSGGDMLVGMANPWTEAPTGEIEKATGLKLVVPEDAEYTASYMTGMAQASWEQDGASVTERVSFAEDGITPDSETLTALSGLYFTGMQTQSKELTVGGRCPGYMEFQRGSFGGIIWIDEEEGLVYTVSLDPVSDPKQLGDLAEWITPLKSDTGAEGMIIIDGCAVAHDLSAVPSDEIGGREDLIWNIVDGYGITYTDEAGTVWALCRAGEAGVFELAVSSEESPSPWTLGDQIWVGGSKLTELCVEDGMLTFILTDELQSGPAFDVEIR